MEFPLTEEIVSQIIFAMENQEGSFRVDRSTGAVVRADAIKPKETQERFLDLPSWTSSDGFQLMERFVGSLRNPIFREQLTEALSSGRGVFRAFKDVAKKNREVERLWFAFKEREMRKTVIQWYGEQRELEGYARLGPEPEFEVEELIASDFSVRPVVARDLEDLFRLDRLAFHERFPGRDPARVEAWYRRQREGLLNPLGPGHLILVAATPSRRFAGFTWGREVPDFLGEEKILELVQLAVSRHYRGLGLAGILASSLCREAHDRGFSRVRAVLEGEALSMSRMFEHRRFAPAGMSLELDLTVWEREEEG